MSKEERGQKSVEAVERVLPELSHIQDESLRKKVAQTWLETWELSNWDRLEDVPFTEDLPDVRLIEHVRAVANATLALARIFAETHRVPVNIDYLMAGTLLHDVSKIVEYHRAEGGKFAKSKLGKLIPHGYYGAHVALNLKLPTEIAHLVITHTKASPIAPEMPEGILIHYVDFCDADFLRIARGIKTFLAKEHER